MINERSHPFFHFFYSAPVGSVRILVISVGIFVIVHQVMIKKRVKNTCAFNFVFFRDRFRERNRLRICYSSAECIFVFQFLCLLIEIIGTYLFFPGSQCLRKRLKANISCFWYPCCTQFVSLAVRFLSKFRTNKSHVEVFLKLHGIANWPTSNYKYEYN